MAFRCKTTVSEYDIDVSESAGCVEGKCGSCSTKVCGKTGVTSNFATHLKVGICSNGFDSV